MKLLGSTENKIAKDKNGENVAHLEITQVLLVDCNIVNNDYEQDSRVLFTFVPNKPFGNSLKFLQKIISSKKHLTQNFKPLMYDLLIKIDNH